MLDFTPFMKISRWSRDIVITEKIDGTNGSIYIEDDFRTMHIGSRTRWITPENDNYGFARWCLANYDELLKLGPGTHFGEWWGSGIQRKYDLNEKRFSLFNTAKWSDDNIRPNCCHVVPVLYKGPLSCDKVIECLEDLKTNGSKASPGFMNPEGIVIFHTAANMCFKKTIKNDDKPKSLVNE